MSIRITLADALAEPVDDHTYNICGVKLRTDVAAPCLSRFADTARQSFDLDAPCGLSLSSQTSQQRTIVGALAGRERRLEIETREHGLRIEIDSVAEFSINFDGSVIRLLRRAPGVDRAAVLECVLGAPLVLSLALRGRWFLHASAVDVGGHVVAFAGASGAGKSTLAALMDRQPGISRVADDLLCYGARGGVPVAVPGFPQMKLDASEQSDGARTPLAAVYVLTPVKNGIGLSFRYLRGRDKLLGILDHGVAARVFPPPVLAEHLKITARLIEHVDVVEASYPKTHEAQATLMQSVIDTHGAAAV